MGRLPQKFEVRDTRNGDWVWVYKSVVSDPHLTHADVRVYSALASFDSKNHEIFPSYDTLSELANVSRRKTLESIKNLVLVEYISVEKGGGRKISNQYILLKKPKGCKFCTVSERVQKTTQKGAENDTERVQSVASNKNKEQEVYKERRKTNRFIPPSLNDIKNYCKERGNNIDAQGFLDFYESKGWLIGKNKMKDWKASVRTWERRNGFSKPDEVEEERAQLPDIQYCGECNIAHEVGKHTVQEVPKI